MSDPRTTDFVIALGASASQSVRSEDLYLHGLRAPTMEATTTMLYLETTEDADTVVDASATWDPVFTAAGTRVSFAVSAAAPQRVQLDTPFGRFGRVRLVAVTAGGVAVVQTAAKTIKPRWSG